MQSPDGLGAQSPAWATETKGIKAMQAMAARARGLIFITLSDVDFMQRTSAARRFAALRRGSAGFRRRPAQHRTDSLHISHSEGRWPFRTWPGGALRPVTPT